MIEYAKSHGVKLLQTYNGCIGKDLTNATVRAAVIKDALSEAPAPYGSHKQANTSVDGLFCDIECTEQPCPWLDPEHAAGQALFFKELKEKWPTVLLSLYVSGAPSVRITARGALPPTAQAFPFGYSAAQVRPMAPYLDQVVYGGYASLNYSFLGYNTEVDCTIDPHAPAGSDTCGGVNSNQTVRYALEGTGGSGESSREWRISSPHPIFE
eukprot:SAG22_NODE_1454_length_4388_cov_65.736302_4_plen_211_part_00